MGVEPATETASWLWAPQVFLIRPHLNEPMRQLR